MDGNLEMANQLENNPEPGDIFHLVFPEMCDTELEHLEKAYLETIKVFPNVSINSFINLLRGYTPLTNDRT